MYNASSSSGSSLKGVQGNNFPHHHDLRLKHGSAAAKQRGTLSPSLSPYSADRLDYPTLETPSTTCSMKGSQNRQHSPIADNDSDQGNGRFFKTRMCVFHQKGACVKGETCTYAHHASELRQIPDLIKTRLCQDWLNCRCTADKCKFAHGKHELRFTKDYYKTKLCHFWLQGACTKGRLCRHAHGATELRPMTTHENASLELHNSIVCYNDTVTTPTQDNALYNPAVPPSTSQIDHEEDNLNWVPAPCARSKKVPASSAAVLQIEAMRLAEEARVLMARSTELLQTAASCQQRPLDAQSSSTTMEPMSSRESLRVDNDEAWTLGVTNLINRPQSYAGAIHNDDLNSLEPLTATNPSVVSLYKFMDEKDLIF